MNAPAILLVEDDAADAALIMDGLSRVVSREQVEVCPDGAAALDFLNGRGRYAGRAADELPRFALLDLTLPGVSGFDVLRAIRAEPEWRLLPVTVLSASDNIEDVRAAARFGANSFVRKSADGRAFAETLGQLARYWLDLNIPPPCCGGQ
ncbi:MAG TPA: response regulator [Rhodocyclaceae bacterium]